MTVLVEAIPELKGYVSELELQTILELKLRQNGLTVEDGEGVTGLLPYLYLALNVIKVRDSTHFVYSADLSFKKYGSFIVPPGNTAKSIRATTWIKSVVGIVPNDSAARTIRETTGTLVDMFLNEYLKANPK